MSIDDGAMHRALAAGSVAKSLPALAAHLPGMTTPALRRTEVAARDIRVGDRMHRNGRTRFAAKNVRPDRILWRVTTTGSRSPSIVSYGPNEVVTVWRPEPLSEKATSS